MRSHFVIGPVLSLCERYVRNYVFAFCACGWGRVLFRNFWAGKVCFCVFVFPENKPVDITLASSQGLHPHQHFVTNIPSIINSYVLLTLRQSISSKTH